jgi:hypothetical protein
MGLKYAEQVSRMEKEINACRILVDFLESGFSEESDTDE